MGASPGSNACCLKLTESPRDHSLAFDAPSPSHTKKLNVTMLVLHFSRDEAAESADQGCGLPGWLLSQEWGQVLADINTKQFWPPSADRPPIGAASGAQEDKQGWPCWFPAFPAQGDSSTVVFRVPHRMQHLSWVCGNVGVGSGPFQGDGILSSLPRTTRYRPAKHA